VGAEGLEGRNTISKNDDMFSFAAGGDDIRKIIKRRRFF
jgi:hypothetical protein